MEGRSQPWGLHLRSRPSFIITTVAMGLFTDLFLYGIVVPVLPFILRDRFQMPEPQIQPYTSALLAAYAGASVLFSVPAGWIAGKLGPRKLFLPGLAFLFAATTIFAFAKSLALLVVARVLQGISTAIVWTSGLAIVQETVASGEIGQAIGTIFASISVGELVAPVLGGILYDKAGMLAVFGVGAHIFAADLFMWFCIIDKNTVAKYGSCRFDDCAIDRDRQTSLGTTEPEGLENAALLPKNNDEEYIIPGELGNLVQLIPILYCFRESRLQVAMLLSFVQALLMGSFDATVPTEAESLFHFSSLQIGLLFIALMVPYLALGRIAGIAIDRYGTKAVATSGYAFLIPCLALLGLPEQGVATKDNNVIMFCVILALNGIGLAMVSSPGFVEAIDVTSKYEAANPGYFGENGPYAQLFGFNSVYFFAGLAVGPVVGGMLRASFGYGVMALIFAAISAIAAILSFLVIGERRR